MELKISEIHHQPSAKMGLNCRLETACWRNLTLDESGSSVIESFFLIKHQKKKKTTRVWIACGTLQMTFGAPSCNELTIL